MHNLNKVAIATATASLIAMAACAPSARPATDTAADEAVFRAGTATWLEAHNAGDVDRVVALYAEDGIMMPPNAPSASGHPAMRAFMIADTAAANAAGLSLAARCLSTRRPE